MPIQPLGDRQSIYNEFMKGCFDMYGAEDCIISENGRTVHNLHRIKYMVVSFHRLNWFALLIQIYFF